METDKAKWIDQVKRYSDYAEDHIIHPFFGRLSKEQVGRLVYKHMDHHLRQFNV